MWNRQVDTATTSESIKTFVVCRNFYADHFGNQILRVRLYFYKDMDQILFWLFSSFQKKWFYSHTFRQLFSLKSKLGEKLISACCRASFALSNWQCYHSRSFYFSGTTFGTLLLSMHPTVNRRTHQKFNKIFQVSMDSDAVFHEESEHLIGFKIWVTNDELSSTFRKKCFLFFAKSAKKCRKVEKVFYLYLYKNRFDFGNFFYQNDQHKKLYKLWKFY
jgi:hypothetical protein